MNCAQRGEIGEENSLLTAQSGAVDSGCCTQRLSPGHILRAGAAFQRGERIFSSGGFLVTGN